MGDDSSHGRVYQKLRSGLDQASGIINNLMQELESLHPKNSEQDKQLFESMENITPQKTTKAEEPALKKPRDEKVNSSGLDIIAIEKLEKDMGMKSIIFRVSLVKSYEKVFRFHALDDSGEISVVAFNDKYEYVSSLIKVNETYKMQKFSVVDLNPTYPDYTGHKFTIKILQDTRIEKHAANIKDIPFNPKAITDVIKLEQGSLLDIIGVVGFNSGLTQGKEKQSSRRNIIITQGEGSLSVTLWGLEAEEFGEEEYMAVGIRNAVVGLYDNTKFIDCRRHTLVWKSPDRKEAEEMLAFCVPKLKEVRETIEKRAHASKSF